MRHRFRFLVLLLAVAPLLAALTSGCGAGAPDFTGTWEGEVRIRAGADADQPDAALTLSGMRMTLAADHTFTLKVLLLPIEGRWRSSGNDLVLSPEKIMGVSPSDFRETMAPAADQPADLAKAFTRERRLRWFDEDRSLRLVVEDTEQLQIRFRRPVQELENR